jgi:transposase
VNPHPISDQTWERIRAEFTLPTLAQVRRRLSELMEDPEPVMRQIVRVFLSGLSRLCPI